MMILRHLLSILLLPFTVVVVVPVWGLRAWRAGGDAWPPSGAWPAGSAAALAGHAVGAAVFAVGFALFAWCVALFARVGQGTLAPWDPTRRFVGVGPYRRVRNPMILGVLTVLLGESIFLGSRAVAAWLLTFLAINQVYFLALEEPGLDRRFGESYRAYKRDVPRWLPRLRPRATPDGEGRR